MIQNEHDGVLTGALAEIMRHLKFRPYDGIADDVEGALQGAADAFVDKLARHLRHEEEVLFPAIRAAVPDASGPIERLEEEHRLLRVYATELAYRIKEKDQEGAYEVSRSFLAALFDHIDRERKIVDERLGALKA
ncbi:MAG TPA: hemerythrin domain-containing protein [Planctomycetota bacterium]|nr:hemerythrin domain-containing protein [Planctomycetota bacterium]